MGKKENIIIIFIRIAFIFCTVVFLWGRLFIQHGDAVYQRVMETEADMWMLAGFFMAAFAACYFAHKSYRGYKKIEKLKEELDKTQYMFQVESLLFHAHIHTEGMKEALKRVGECRFVKHLLH